MSERPVPDCQEATRLWQQAFSNLFPPTLHYTYSLMISLTNEDFRSQLSSEQRLAISLHPNINLVRAFVFNCRLLPDEIARILLVHQQDSEIESYVARHQNIEDMMAARDIISQSELDLTSY